MDVNRRGFLKFAAGTGVALVSTPLAGHAGMPKELPPEAVGILYDATLCIGCKSCMVNCKTYNSMEGGALYTKDAEAPPYEFRTAERIYDAPENLSAKTLNVIKVHVNGTGAVKDRAEDGYSLVKQHCLHCISPACVAACPVAALKKDPVNGVVYYDKDRCMGCRYCQLACPFGIPKFEWEETKPEIRKCQLCRHRIEKGEYPACCEFCPTGASIFGRVTDLRKEAKRRLTLPEGSRYKYPVQKVDSSFTMDKKVAAYVDHVYGLNEAGGTQYLLLAGVPLNLLGFNPGIPNAALPDLSWKYIAKIPAVAGLVIAAGAGSWAITRRNNGSGKGE